MLPRGTRVWSLPSIDVVTSLTSHPRNGVPQLLLPMWADCFDFAMRAEYRKIGIYGNRKAHPWVDGDELAVAFKRVLGDGEEARMIRESAKKLGEKKRKTPGRECAAREVARLARN